MSLRLDDWERGHRDIMACLNREPLDRCRRLNAFDSDKLDGYNFFGYAIIGIPEDGFKNVEECDDEWIVMVEVVDQRFEARATSSGEARRMAVAFLRCLWERMQK